MFSFPLYELCIQLKGFIKSLFTCLCSGEGGKSYIFDVSSTFHVTGLKSETTSSKSCDSNVP